MLRCSFNGTIVAITHNPQFAMSLQPTHALRVANGAVKYAELLGELTEEDFDHGKHAPQPQPQPAAAKSAAAGGKSAAGGKGAAKASKAQAASASKAPAASTSGSSTSTSSSGNGKAAAAVAASSAAASKPGASKRTLSWKEKQEYEKLQKVIRATYNGLHSALARMGSGALTIPFRCLYCCRKWMR